MAEAAQRKPGIAFFRICAGSRFQFSEFHGKSIAETRGESAETRGDIAESSGMAVLGNLKFQFWRVGF